MDGNAPTITSKKYIFFGRVEIVIQAAFGAGVVTSAVLQSDCLDEIDWVGFPRPPAHPRQLPSRRSPVLTRDV